LVEALKLDLFGPDNDHKFAHELLPDAPSRWYLTGFLVPSEAPIEQESDETTTEGIDFGGEPYVGSYEKWIGSALRPNRAGLDSRGTARGKPHSSRH
jgi:hypothetical protein